MLGLFGTLELGARSLQTQRMGVEVAGHNIANVNNPAYSRQRLDIATSSSIQTAIGPQGTGGDAVSITRLRSEVIDQQIRSESGVSGYLESQQQALQFAKTALGQSIKSSTGSGTAQQGLNDSLNSLFGAFQSLGNSPASSSERQTVLANAEEVAQRFNSISEGLVRVDTMLNHQVESDVQRANRLLSEIAWLNQQVARAEAGQPGSANDLRDTREAKIEALSKLTALQVAENPDGSLDLSVGGTTLVSGWQEVDKLQAYDAGAGKMLVQSQATGAPLTLGSGSIAGAIDLRNGDLSSLRSGIDQLASNFITEVNAAHANGYNLSGGTGTPFFLGTGAGDIRVNPALSDNPALLQASGTAGASGDNQVVLAMSALSRQTIPGLNNRTFNDSYGSIVGNLGQSMASVNSRLEDQQLVQSMLATQRDSVSGVSLDEEMTNMMKYQKAYEASARLISVISEMLDTVLQMRR